jgi:alkanesulfonate monooxygenase SsuD/methylene tetrahydromethanopterin reductase-like flavin-dependent oxidoreductase (luciferase family)
VQVVLGEEGLGQLLEVGRRVEALGFDGCFIFDHPAIQADPWMCLAALAGVTERVRLGSLVNCVSYRHPAYLARLAADLDNISRGRLLLGLGIGWLKPEFEGFGVTFDPPATRYAALEEALEIIPGVWGAEKFAYMGEHYTMGPVQIAPPPLQQPRPPLIIGGGGEKRTLRLVARYADACNISNNGQTERGLERLGGPELIAHKLDLIRGYCAEYGRPFEDILRTHFTLRLVLAETEQALAAKIAASAKAVSGSPGTRRALPSAFVTGIPEHVAADYQALADVGIQYFTVQVDAGDTETLELLASEVVPRVRMAS